MKQKSDGSLRGGKVSRLSAMSQSDGMKELWLHVHHTSSHSSLAFSWFLPICHMFFLFLPFPAFFFAQAQISLQRMQYFTEKITTIQ